MAKQRRENGLSMRVLQPPATPGNTLILPYKEEVAGSNPASPTLEKQRFAGKTECTGEAPNWSEFVDKGSEQESLI
jgi:hypothetical protein